MRHKPLTKEEIRKMDYQARFLLLKRNMDTLKEMKETLRNSQVIHRFINSKKT